MAKRAAILLSSTLLVTACAGPNVDAPIGGVVTVEALQEQHESEPLSQVPTTLTLDRSHWKRIDYTVPVDTDPRYAGSLLTNSQKFDQVPAYGAFPTTESCVNLDRQNPHEILDILTAPFIAVVDLPVSFIPGSNERTSENLAERNAPIQRAPAETYDAMMTEGEGAT